MTGSQYKNIIKWTLYLNQGLKESNSIEVANKIFTNLGVSFPHGNYNEVFDTLKTEKFLGWVTCSRNEVQRFANIGVASLGIDSEKIIVIIPDYDINDLTASSDIVQANNTFVRHSSELDNEEYADLQFFVYSYGYKFED